MKRLLGSLVLTLFASILFAQDQSLIEALSELGKKEGVSFSYDAALLEDVVVSRDIRTVQDLLILVEGGALTIEEVGKGEFLILPKKTTIQLSLNNQNQEESLQEFYVDIIRGDNEVLYQNFIADPQKPISFEWMPRPADTVKIISSTYDPVNLPLSVLLLKSQQSIELKEKVRYLDEVIIENYVTKGIELNVKEHTTSIAMDELALIPGETDGDVLASLATIPGINSPDSRAGNLYIHGSSVDQNLILYNNIPIYHRGHYFGTISPYNPAVISDVEISKNGFNPRLGGRVGGSIQIHSSSSLSDFDEMGVGINSLYGNAYAKKKVGQKVGVSVAARRSLPSGFVSPKLIQISDMVYSATAITDPQYNFDLQDINVRYEDYNANIMIVPGNNDKISVSGLYTKNTTNYQLINDTANFSSLEGFSFENGGVSLGWEHAFNDRLSGKLSAFQSTYTSEYSNTFGDGVNDNSSDNRLEDTGVNYEVMIGAKGQHTTSVGVATQHTQVSYIYRSRPQGVSPLNIIGNEQANVHSLYTNFSSSGQHRFYYQVGGRLDYYTATDRAYISPRLFLNYDVSDHLIAKASAGRYYQYLNQVKYLQFGDSGFDNELWRLSGNQGIETLQSDQYMVGGLWTKGRVVVDVEGYQKVVNNVNYSSTFRLRPGNEYEQARWDILGVDIFSKVHISNGFSLWGSYEYSTHKITFDSLETVSYTYKYNRPHRFKVGGLYQRGRWKLSFSGKILSGLYGRSLDLVSQLGNIYRREYVVPPPPPPPGPGMPPPLPPRPIVQEVEVTLEDLPERYEAFKSLDLFITYDLPQTVDRRWRATFGLSLINVLNATNQIDNVTRGLTDRLNLLSRNGLGFSPNLNVSISW